MNCNNCGKEIPEGENKLCDECQKKLLEEISNEGENTSVETKVEETKKEKDDSSKFKVSGSSEKNSKTNIVIAAAIIIVVIALGILCAVKLTGYVPGNLGGLSAGNVGNSIGNIRNYGYGTYDGKWIYYVAPNEDASKVGLYRVKNNNTDVKEELLVDDIDIISVNVYKDHIYFIGVGLEAFSEEDYIDNKIYRMKKDGSDLEVINNNEFNNDCYEIYAVNDSIYYIGVDENIYKMNLDGTNPELVSNNGTGYIGITDKYIIYNVENEAGDNYITHIMNLDGTNSRPIIENARLYSVDIAGNYVYYTNTDKHIYRTKIDSGEEELILAKTAYNLNLKNNYLYFLNYVDAENEDYTVALYRIKADGSQEQEEAIKTLSLAAKYINVVGDWVMYMDYDKTSGFINLVNRKGTGAESKIYVLEYDESDSNEPEEVPTEPDANTVPTEATDTNTAPTNEAVANEIANTVTNEVANNVVTNSVQQ